jgi:hypothetical protein
MDVQDPWQGWSFVEDFFVSPNGDRFTPACILACVYLRQLPGFMGAVDKVSKIKPKFRPREKTARPEIVSKPISTPPPAPALARFG